MKTKWLFALLAVFLFAAATVVSDIFPIDGLNTWSYLWAAILIQSVMVIITLIVTVAAMQIISSAYTTRVAAQAFGNNPDLWALLGLYGISIFYGLTVLVQGSGNISVVFWLGIFSFVALLAYVWRVFNLLNPTKLINRLAEDITAKKMLKALRAKR